MTNKLVCHALPTWFIFNSKDKVNLTIRPLGTVRISKILVSRLDTTNNNEPDPFLLWELKYTEFLNKTDIKLKIGKIDCIIGPINLYELLWTPEYAMSFPTVTDKDEVTICIDNKSNQFPVEGFAIGLMGVTLEGDPIQDLSKPIPFVR